MGYALLMLLGGGALWLLFLGIQLIALSFIVTIGLAIAAIFVIYGLCFLGLYFILGEANTGWAIFGAMGLGTMLLSIIRKQIPDSD